MRPMQGLEMTQCSRNAPLSLASVTLPWVLHAWGTPRRNHASKIRLPVHSSLSVLGGRWGPSRMGKSMANFGRGLHSTRLRPPPPVHRQAPAAASVTVTGAALSGRRA
jgi:hypothetical protein